MTQMQTTRRVEPVNELGNDGLESSAAGSIIAAEAGALSAVAREEAEIKAAFILARRFPRDEYSARLKIEKSCDRPRFAESACYRFPRGDKMVEGPSVHLAREMARCWGNLRSGLRIVTLDEDYVHIKGYALDLETNNYIDAEDKFEKLIFRKKGGWVKPDERDLRELINRRGAICVRNSILQVLPPDVTEDAIIRAADTMRKAANGDVKQNPVDAIRRLVSAFDAIGIGPEMLKAYLKHDLQAIIGDELADLRMIYKSINDGNSKREDYFDLGAAAEQQQADKAEALRERLKPQTQPPASTTASQTPAGAADAAPGGAKATETQIKEPVLLDHPSLVTALNESAMDLGIPPAIVNAGLAESIKGKNNAKMKPAERLDIWRDLVNRRGAFALGQGEAAKNA